VGVEPTLEQRLKNCRSTAVHLEMRDGYMRSDPRYIAWLNGVRDAPEDNDPALRPWLTLVAELTARGVEVLPTSRRVRRSAGYLDGRRRASPFPATTVGCWMTSSSSSIISTGTVNSPPKTRPSRMIRQR
jgi:hypothetical protein